MKQLTVSEFATKAGFDSPLDMLMEIEMRRQQEFAKALPTVQAMLRALIPLANSAVMA